MPSYSVTERFAGKLRTIALVDELLAEAIRLECEFFGLTARAREGYDAPGMLDIWNVRVCGLHGDILTTLSAFIRDGAVTFFDVPFMEMPENDPLTD